MFASATSLHLFIYSKTLKPPRTSTLQDVQSLFVPLRIFCARFTVLLETKEEEWTSGLLNVDSALCSNSLNSHLLLLLLFIFQVRDVVSRIDTAQPLRHNYGRFRETANSPPPSLFNNRLTKGFLRRILKSQGARFALIIEPPPSNPTLNPQPPLCL